MGFTKINVGAVIGLSSDITKAQNKVDSIQSAFCSTYSRIDGRILARNQIGRRLSIVSSKMSSVESLIGRIKSTVENSAERYQTTDQKVSTWSDRQNVGMGSVGAVAAIGALVTQSMHTASVAMGAALGAVGDVFEAAEGMLGHGESNAGGSLDTLGIDTEDFRHSSGRAAIEDEEETRSVLARFANNELKKEWATLYGEKESEGSFLEVDSAGSMKGSLLHREVKLENKMSFGFDKENGKFNFDEFGISTEAVASFAVAKGEAEGNWGLLHGKGEAEAITGAATAEAKFAFYDDGKFNPSASLSLKAEGSVLKGEGEIGLGTDQYGVYVKADGDVLHAEAELNTGIGYIGKDENGNSIYGGAAKVSAMASVAQGNAKAGFTLAGIDIDFGVKGYLLAAGIEAGGSMSTEGVTANFSGALGLGAGFDVSVDWSDAKWVGDTIDTVGGFAKDGLELQADAAEFVGNMAEKTGNTVGDFAKGAAQVVGDTTEAVTDVASTLVEEKIGNLAGEKIGAFAGDAVEFIGDTTGGIVKGGLEFIGNTAEVVGEGVGGFFSGVADVASGAGDFLFGWID